MSMKGKLTDDEMDVLESLIGDGPKTFTLLYAITRDGCNAPSFHQKCDNKGPTVTVLYNQNGSIYGGYTSASWHSNAAWICTSDSFLFQLTRNGKLKGNKFLIKPTHYQNSIFGNSNYGPTFGSGNDLCTFTNTVSSAGSYFPLNGNMNFGTAYETSGFTAAQINGGTMNVTELEVYKVAYGQRKLEPWRETRKWNNQYLNELTQEIVSFKPKAYSKVTKPRILMIGPIGAGKSSFFNTVNSVFAGRMTNRACSGSADQSLTTAYTPYTVQTRNGTILNFRFCDTRGLEESTGLDDQECAYILDGHMPDNYQFSDTTLFSPETPGFRLKPSPDDQIHCVVFLLDATTLDVLSPALLEKIKSLQHVMNKKGIPQLILLTKIDKLCVNVEKDVSSVFISKAVERHVDKAAQLLGLPRLSVLPVKNYEREHVLNMNINILALMAVKRISDLADDFLQNLSESSSDMQCQMEELQIEK